MDYTVVGVIGMALPLAVGVALSPIPLIAVVLLLMSPRGRRGEPVGRDPRRRLLDRPQPTATQPRAFAVWLTANNSIVMGVLLVVIGAVVIGGAITEL